MKIRFSLWNTDFFCIRRRTRIIPYTMNDYSDFYYGNYKKMMSSSVLSDTEEQTLHTVVDARNIKEKKKETKEKKPKDKRKILIAFCVLIASIALLFLSVELLSPKGLVSELSAFFVKNPAFENAYAVNFGSFSTLEEARGLAGSLRDMGGGGYIVFDGKYNVLSSAYRSETEAKTIAESNGGTVYPIAVEKVDKTNFPIKLRDAVSKTEGYKELLFEKLYSLSVGYDEGVINEQQVRAEVKLLLGQFQALTEQYMSEYSLYPEKTVLDYCVALTAAEGMLNNLLDEDLERPDLLADLRYSYLLILFL